MYWIFVIYNESNIQSLEIDPNIRKEALENDNESVPADTSLKKMKLDSTLGLRRVESTGSRARSKSMFNQGFKFHWDARICCRYYAADEDQVV